MRAVRFHDRRDIRTGDAPPPPSRRAGEAPVRLRPSAEAGAGAGDGAGDAAPGAARAA